MEEHQAEILSVFKNDVKMGDGYTMLDRSLLIESLLTSPNGQFVDIRRASEHSQKRFDFYYGRAANAQRNIHDLEKILEGAADCVEYAFNHGVRYSTEEIESLFETFAYSRRQFPRATWVMFDVDDAISGHGNVNPLRLFGL